MAADHSAAGSLCLVSVTISAQAPQAVAPVWLNHRQAARMVQGGNTRAVQH